MDLGSSIFEFGQIYVALSRIQSLEGLFLQAFEPSRIKENPKVKQFYRGIPEVPDSFCHKEVICDSSSNTLVENIFETFAYKEEGSIDIQDPTIKKIRL
jgi:hypothetical protein